MPDYSTCSEDELLQLLKGNDEQAFTEIYNRYWEKLLAIGFYYLHHKQGAEDIVQEVLISLWKRRKELAIQSLQAYLATAVKFAVFKAIVREKKRRERSAAQAPLDDSNETEKKLDARFLLEYLHQLTEQLPEKTRLVFAYREEKITVNEIAVRTNLSPKAVEYHVTKALRALREGLKKIKLFFV